MTDTSDEGVQALLKNLKAALALSDRGAINRVVAALLALNAPLGQQWASLAQLMTHNGELALARDAMAAFVRAQGQAAAASFQHAVLLATIGDYAEAKRTVSIIPAGFPSPETRAHFEGVVAMNLGDFSAARENFQVALRHHPIAGPTWLSLVALGNMAADPIANQLLAVAPNAGRQPPSEYAQFLFAVGKVHADRNDHAAAYGAFANAAAVMATLRRHDLAADDRGAALSIAGFDPPPFKPADAGQDMASTRPIFVLGNPRSGSTLVETILTSHSAVIDGAELNRFKLVALSLGGPGAARLTEYRRRAGTLKPLAADYLHLASERFGASGRFVDKTLNHSRMLGLIAAILPAAPLVWVRRDPLDCAWSCFRTYFAQGADWSHSQTNIAAHFRLEDQLLDFWTAVLGERLLIVPYEELVNDPTSWTKRLLSHCGLPAESTTCAPHEQSRVASTSSIMQVREPINRKGIGVAEPYRKFMQPFIAAYYD
ncbi:sulfotransferase family protein [Sphingomonas koreensis]|nr:sulfotransferase family protein [Sphingomonas koreensis]